MSRTLYFTVLLFSCSPSHAPRPVTTDHPDDQDSEVQCVKAEERLLGLACRDSRGRLLGGPNRKGEAFHNICLTAVANGVSLRPACIARITSCDQVQPCLEAK